MNQLGGKGKRDGASEGYFQDVLRDYSCGRTEIE